VNLLIYTVLGLALTWALYLAYMYIATRASEGRSAQTLYQYFPALGSMSGRALVYCYSPRCGPCKPMSKEVDSLVTAGAPVFKLDITEHPELCREYGIRVTPTLILIENGIVSRLVIGVKTASYMRALIAEPG
jgi:thioredoxin 1